METRARVMHMDFVEARGGVPDRKPNPNKPYSAASYAAQYGVPIDDVRDYLSSHSGCTHGEVKEWIYEEYLKDPQFRTAAVNHVVRPFGEWSAGEKKEISIQGTTLEEARRINVARRAGALDPKSIPNVESVEIDREGL